MKKLVFQFFFLLLPLLLHATDVLIVADEQGPMAVMQSDLVSQGHAVTMVDQAQLPTGLSGYDAVFQYIHGAMTEATSQALIHYTRQGGRLILLHHALASARMNNPAFLAFAGLHLNPRDHPQTPWKVLGNVIHTVVNLNPSHYISSNQVSYPQTIRYRCAGPLVVEGDFPAFDLPQTECFLNQQFTDGYEKTVLFGFQTTDPETGVVIQQDRSGWLKPAGKGWIIYLQPGHAKADFAHPSFRQIIRNCLTWEP
ncbi:MAG: ThuA domain-containing protein [bacterium]|jgi:hypothetical protein|nr:ThuA domain-containing protein [bacterium]